jgi:curved DNA-binding protein CbpA
MGNTSAKQQVYQQYYEQTTGSPQAIDLSNLDPYKVLNVPQNFTWQQLKDAYRQAALKTHPDKEGGNKIAFDFVTNCFKTLADEYKARSSNKSHHDLKKDSTEYFEKIIPTGMQQHPSDAFKVPFEQRFNKAFDECKYVDEDIEYGYGKFMQKSDGKREDISVNNIFNKGKVDNNTFNEAFNKKVPTSKEIIKYTEPEPLIMAKNLKFTEIGAKRPDDYSSRIENQTLSYTDYMKAHSGTRNINPETIKTREFKNVEEYEAYRDRKLKRGMTEKERRYMEEKKNREEQEEFERLERIRQQNMAIQKAHEKANRLLLQ